jgi:hypothetical protein
MAKSFRITDRVVQGKIVSAVCKELDETDASELIAQAVLKEALKGVEWAIKFCNECDLNVINRKLEISNKQANNAENLIETLKSMQVTTQLPLPEHIREQYDAYEEVEVLQKV